MLELYKNIKKRREELGLSQEALAQKVGYTNRSTIARIEHGEIDLPQSMIMKFANALRISPFELMGMDGYDGPTNSDSIMIGEDLNKPAYLLDPKAAEIAQEYYENPDRRIVFDLVRNIPPEDLELTKSILEKMSNK